MFDICVIGGGPGGYAAAIRASQLGAKVALVETEKIGGTCVNKGCIPTKVWQHTACILNSIKGAAEFGIKASQPDLDLKVISERAKGVSNYIRMGMEGLLKSRKVEMIKGRAILKSPQEVKIDENVFETRKIILATGSEIRPSNIPGLAEAAWTTDQMVHMTEIPSSVLIWGSAEFIEVEMAGLLNALGCNVFLAFETLRILPREDGDTSQRISQALKEQGVNLLPRITLESVTPSNAGYRCLFSGTEEKAIGVERVLVTSRRPRTTDLGLEQIGVEITDDGAIRIDNKLRTNIGGIYAVGDVTGGWMLSHAASSSAILAAENAMGDSKSFPYHLIPRGIWATPEMGAVGLSEEDAQKMGMEIEVGDFPYAINGMAMAQSKMMGAAKIISDTRNGKLLGVHLVGARATELIGEAVMAMQLKANATDLSDSIRMHPTFSETIGEAARDVNKWALYLPKL